MKQALLVVLVLMVSYLTWAFRGAIYADQATTKVPTGVIRVTVADDTAQAVSDATVTIRSESGKYATTVNAADSTAAYVFQVNTNEAYDIVATIPGKVASQTVALEPSQILELTLVPQLK